MEQHPVYRAKTFELGGLAGISDKTLEMHFKLYEGYVQQTNLLHEKIAEIPPRREDRPGGDAGVFRAHPATRVRVQRHGAARVLLREPARGGGGDPARDAAFRRVAEASFGSYDVWKADFVGVGKMRGVGWAICYHDPRERPALEPLDHAARGGERRRLHADPRDGRLGARVPARLQAARTDRSTSTPSSRTSTGPRSNTRLRAAPREDVRRPRDRVMRRHARALVVVAA
jgi:superoxide dismutase